jgi:acetyl-CoA synthetase
MADKPLAEIADLLQEDRTFEPSSEFRDAANVRDAAVYDRAEADPEGFWANFAKELEWSKPWTRILEWNPPPREVVCRGDVERQRQLHRSPHPRFAPQ